MKRLINVFITFSLLLISLTACDPGVEYSMVIENESNYEVLILPDTSGSIWLNFDQIDSLTIPSNSDFTIGGDLGIGTVDGFTDCPFISDSFAIAILGVDSLNVNINVYDSTKWEYKVLEETGYGGGSCECRLVIRDADIN